MRDPLPCEVPRPELSPKRSAPHAESSRNAHDLLFHDEEPCRYDWRSATSVLRNIQYTEAERLFKLKMQEKDHKRAERRRLLRRLTFGLLGRE